MVLLTFIQPLKNNELQKLKWDTQKWKLLPISDLCCAWKMPQLVTNCTRLEYEYRKISTISRTRR